MSKGRPGIPRPQERHPLNERIQRHIASDPETGCWLWTGAIGGDGYGRMQVIPDGVAMERGRSYSRKAHRVSYEVFVGPIPPGLVLDHLCRVRNCVNPAHLEPVTDRVNVMRGETIPARNAAKTHCDAGHAFSPENTHITPAGFRSCRKCRSLRQQRYYRERKAARIVREVAP